MFYFLTVVSEQGNPADGTIPQGKPAKSWEEKRTVQMNSGDTH